MSRVERIDLAALRARLILAIEGHDDLPGSVYLHGIGALYLAAAPEAAAEIGMWASLFELQAQIENVNGADILAALASCTAVIA